MYIHTVFTDLMGNNLKLKILKYNLDRKFFRSKIDNLLPQKLS